MLDLTKCLLSVSEDGEIDYDEMRGTVVKLHEYMRGMTSLISSPADVTHIYYYNLLLLVLSEISDKLDVLTDLIGDALTVEEVDNGLPGDSEERGTSADDGDNSVSDSGDNPSDTV